LCWIALLFSPVLGQAPDPVLDALLTSQFDLSTAGKRFLLQQAADASFFLIGGLHGDNETQALIVDLWPDMQKAGYRYISVEMSPWAAARFGAALKIDHLRGTDIEERQPQLLIRDLAAANPDNKSLESLAELTRKGFRPDMAPQVLRVIGDAGAFNDPASGGIPLRTQLVKTLEVSAARSARVGGDTRQQASILRETVMKEFFVAHYRAAPKAKVMTVFGRNHLHRGYDRRGVSTLGNFIAEFAIAEGSRSFHVALFAAGGKISLGSLQEIDETKSDAALQLLASVARYSATVFDLRPLRSALRNAELSVRDSGLLYWADSYDAIICFREVTPLNMK
jgi:hypothetical protein